MIIKKIVLDNIRSYKHEEILFTEGSTLLSGDIGCGKTSILLSIEFALFGLQPGQRGSYLLRNGENEGSVLMEFEIDENIIIVERTLKRNKTISQDYAAITINGEKRELSVTELKTKILELLNYPREFAKKQNFLYKFTVYTPQEEMKEIILQDAETRVNTFRHVFGIDKYKKILENSQIVSLKLREEKRVKEALILNLEENKFEISSKEKELDNMNSKLIPLTSNFSEKSIKRDEIEKEKKEIQKKIDEKNNFSKEIEKTKLVIHSKSDFIKNNEKMIKELDNQIKEFQRLAFDESKIFIIEEEIVKKRKEKEELDSKNLEFSSIISTLNLRNEELTKLELNMKHLEHCPTCLQDVDSVHRSNVLNKIYNDISQNKKRLEELDLEKKNVLNLIKEFESNRILKEKELTDLKILKMKLQGVNEKRQKIEELKKSNESLQKDISLLEKHLEVLSSSVLEFSKFDNLYELKQRELNVALKEERISEIKLAEMKKEIELLSKHIKELKVKVKKTEEIKSQLNYISELETWLSKKFIPLISYIEKGAMTTVKYEFSRLFQEWFSILVSDSFNVKLDEDFTPIIEQQDYELDYSYLSGGERTAIALAYRLALNQVINSIMSKIKTRQLVILDEPTDGFSEQQLDKMGGVLEELNVKQLIIVSHEQKMESFVENVIKFKKEKGESVRV